MPHHEYLKMLFKLCRGRLSVNNRTPGADAFPEKISIEKLVVVGSTAKDLGLKLSRKTTVLSLVKMVGFCIWKVLLLFLHPSGSCCCLGEGSR